MLHGQYPQYLTRASPPEHMPSPLELPAIVCGGGRGFPLASAHALFHKAGVGITKRVCSAQAQF